MSNLVQFATSLGFATVKDATDALGAQFIRDSFASFAATPVELDTTPAIPAWETEVMALVTGTRKDGTPFVVADTVRLTEGSDSVSGVVVGVDGGQSDHVRIIRYARKDDGSLFRYKSQPVWNRAMMDSIAATVAGVLGEVSDTDAEFVRDALDTGTEPTLAEQLAATELRSELLMIAKKHGVAKIPHAAKMNPSTLREKILVAAAKA
jgi:hypothetical protein